MSATVRGMPTAPAAAWPDSRPRRARRILEERRKKKAAAIRFALCEDCGTRVYRPDKFCNACRLPLSHEAITARDKRKGRDRTYDAEV